jgi:4-diphosphocytidyl-2-C-methyl-D-erythritol kinase
MSTVSAPAKINLALVVGPRRRDGKHDVVTVLDRLAIADTLTLEKADGLRVQGFDDDTLVARALGALAARAGAEPAWLVTVDKGIPVAAGLGGGSSDAAAALRLANETLARPLEPEALHGLAAELGADVPFFLAPGPQLGEDDGTRLTPLELPRDFVVVLLLPRDIVKTSTAAVYDAFDSRGGEAGFESRRRDLLDAIARVRRPADIATWPKNDLATSPLAAQLEQAGALRADVSGAGPAVYGLFEREADATSAAARFDDVADTWVTFPTWYG